MLANKDDSANAIKTRAVEANQVEDFIRKNELDGFSECSAITGIGVTDAFSDLSKVLFSKVTNKKICTQDKQILVGKTCPPHRKPLCIKKPFC